MTTPTTKFRSSAEQEIKPGISAYTDHRTYLRDFYEYKRRQTSDSLRPYSYADFSAAADIRSPNYLKLIIEGKRNLSESMMGRFARALGINKEDSDEFKALIRYSQAVDPLERNQYLRQLAELRMHKKARLDSNGKEVLEKSPSWVTWAIHALADQRGVKFDANAIHQTLGHKAKLSEVKEAFETLIESGELVKNNDGEIKKGLKSADKTTEVSAALVRKLQAELIYLGMESLFNDSPNEREFGSVTMGLTDQEFENLKFELRHLRKRVYKDNLIARENTKGERVYQMNIQLFPISKKSI